MQPAMQALHVRTALQLTATPSEAEQTCLERPAMAAFTGR